MSTRIFYDGAWQPGDDSIGLVEPGTGKALAEVGIASDQTAQKAAAGLAGAFESIASMPAWQRSEILERLATAIERDRQALAETIRREAGKPIRLARGEVERALVTTRWAMAEALRWGGRAWSLDIHPTHTGKWGVHFRVPTGPLLAITPFNFPLNLVLHKIAPAIAVGAPFLIKPSPRTPLTALHLTRLILESGWPPQGIATLPCRDSAAAALVTGSDLSIVSFTGSAKVGWTIKTQAGMKKVLLEMGGNAGVIVHEDADIEHAAQRSAYGAYVYAGQVCISVQRIYIHTAVWDRFLEAFLRSARAMNVGPTNDEATDIGPMIDRSSADRVMTWVRDAVLRGAHVLLEGKREGDSITPWALTDVPSTLPLVCEEVFGPVAVLERVPDFTTAVERINASRFGLQAGIFTNRLDLVQTAMHSIHVGGLIVNDIPTVRLDPMPYGGMKASGLGREGIRFAMEALTDIRMVVFCPRPSTSST